MTETLNGIGSERSGRRQQPNKVKTNNIPLVKCRALKTDIQSTLVISKLKGHSETLRDMRTSTYQIFRIEEKYKSHKQSSQMNM